MGQNSNSYLQHTNRDSEAKEINNLYSKLRSGTVICDSQSSDLLFVFLVHFFFSLISAGHSAKSTALRDGGEPEILT